MEFYKKGFSCRISNVLFSNEKILYLIKPLPLNESVTKKVRIRLKLHKFSFD